MSRPAEPPRRYPGTVLTSKTREMLHRAPQEDIAAVVEDLLIAAAPIIRAHAVKQAAIDWGQYVEDTPETHDLPAFGEWLEHRADLEYLGRVEAISCYEEDDPEA